MKLAALLRSYWQELLLGLMVALPWLSLLLFGLLWIWQSGYVAVWALASAVVGLATWPWARYLRKRAREDARHFLADLSKPSAEWTGLGTDAWADVIALADTTPPFTFAELDPVLDRGRETIEAVARRFHPEASDAWLQFRLTDALLLAERLGRDVREQALRYIPGMKALRISHVLWVHRQHEQYGPVAQTAWRVGYGLWRLVRAVRNPLQAAAQETRSATDEGTVGALSYRLRAYFTRLLVLEVGHAAIDLYSGRLALSDAELRAAQRADTEGSFAADVAPVRILLVGQVSAGKSSLLNALAQEVRAAVGPLPTTASASEYRLDVDGQPAVTLVDMPGLDDPIAVREKMLAQITRADLIVWVASATQPARETDRQGLEQLRSWSQMQPIRRVPSVLLALTHVDQLRPAAEWQPPYNVTTPTGTKAQTIRAAMDLVAATLSIATSTIVPIAVPPGREPYNVDALWARIAIEIDEAKLVQLDRVRLGQQRLSLRETANQFANVGRIILKGLAGGR